MVPRIASIPLLLAPVLPAVLLACDNDKPIWDDTGGSGDGGSDGTCGSDAECAGWEICEADTCVDGDRNNSVDEAQGVLWDDTTQGYVNPAGDKDYYTLTAASGEWVRIRTIHDYEGGDTVVTLRDPTGKVVTISDDYPTGGSLSSADSTIYAYLALVGDYIIEVEDRGTYYGEEAAGDPAYAYTLSVETWDVHTRESDAADDPSLEFTVDGFNTYTAIGVLLAEDGDADYVRFSHGLTDGALWFYSMLDLSGSEADPRVRVYDEAGDLVLWREGVVGGDYAYHPAAGAGTYTVELDDSDSQGGALVWFFVFMMMRDNDGAYPVETESNDYMLTASPLTMNETETSSGSTYAYGQATGFIDSEGDEDWFEIPERPDAEIALCITSSTAGSLVAPDVEVYDEAGTLVGSATGSEVVYPAARLDDVFMDAGPYYIRVHDPDGAYTGGGAFYRMVVYTADFDIYAYEDGGYSCPG